MFGRLLYIHFWGQEPPKMYIQETAKHRAKFAWPPLSDIAAVTKPRRKSAWNLLGCPKLDDRSQPLVGWSSPYCDDMSARYCCLTNFFRLLIKICLSCKDIARQSCAMMHRWLFFGNFLHPVFTVNCVQLISDPHPHSKFALRHVWKYDRHPICDFREQARKKRKKEERNHSWKI